VLRQPRFTISPDEAHRARAADVTLVSVLSGPPGVPEICFDAVYQQSADPGDVEAAAALRVLAEEIDGVAVGLVLKPGDLLIIDNRCVVHARTGYQPRYDGIGRWVLRTMVCASRREHRRRAASGSFLGLVDVSGDDDECSSSCSRDQVGPGRSGHGALR
jgi:L-asparagine oxygenase